MKEENHNEYITTLENSIAFLEKEIESLKSDISNREESEIEAFPINMYPEPKLMLCNSKPEAEAITFEYLSNIYSILECLLIKTGSLEKPTCVAFESYNVSMLDAFISLEESGVINWLYSKSDPLVIPNLKDENSSKPTFLILVPLLVKSERYLFIAKTTVRANSISEKDLSTVSNISYNLLVWILFNTTGNEDSESLRSELKSQNKLPLQIDTKLELNLKAGLKSIFNNSQLIEKGIGDRSQRLEHIQQITRSILSLLESKQKANDLGSIIELWKELLVNEGIVIELDINSYFSEQLKTSVLTGLIDNIIAFASSRYDSQSKVYLFIDKASGHERIVVKCDMLHLGLIDEVNKANYNTLDLPENLVTIFDTIYPSGYYLTISEGSGKTVFSISQDSDDVEK
jgi:hypothetical protein